MKHFYDLFEGTEAIAEDNLGFLEDLYQRYLKDPESVDASWRVRFERISPDNIRELPKTTHQTLSEQDLDLALRRQAAVDRLITQYRTRGHQVAFNNPLRVSAPPPLSDLDPKSYGLDENDTSTLFYLDILDSPRRLPLREILQHLRQTYCESIGSEYMHIVDSEVRDWIRFRLENTRGKSLPEAESQRRILRALTAAEGIEHSLHRQYVGQKRFSLEGAESLIPLLDELIECGADKGIREMVIGMAHRGRLNVLVNVLGKTPGALFEEFEGTSSIAPLASAGDVKYHSGFSSNILTRQGPVHTTLAFNPSHLEIIDPVVQGSVRARQDRHGELGEERVMAILIHGDAAFAGQGIVMETLNMAETRAYTTGGTIHIVINNQIGFTTSNPFDARSTLYCTDVANMIQAPVFHVNGDDPEAVLFVTRLAVDYRAKFKRDVVIDLMCYRRHGHNEADEPAVTQPLMYRYIRNHPTTRALYARRLIESGLIDEAEEKKLITDYQDALARNDLVSRPLIDDVTVYPKPNWEPYQGNTWTHPAETRIAHEAIERLCKVILALPEGFELHPRTAAIYTNRQRMALGELPMDWGFAENLAYASIAAEGHSIRLSGQDVGRGTFFHRHAIVHDQASGGSLIPLQSLEQGDVKVQIFDSLLSEEGVLGFEYGYASSAPDVLVLWEAQFGDFANNAQVVIDQFIASGEAKWGRLCGLTLLLPHGYEGQGPEHSSARIERYLQLCAEHNMQVAIPTTPAQVFHLLRRQIKRAYRKPLIVMTPKSLLRHKRAISGLDEITQGEFQPVIGDASLPHGSAPERIILCTGKIYFDLLEARDAAGRTDIALIRLEQLYPFPKEALRQEMARFTGTSQMIWCQEEPENQGAWRQIAHRLEAELGNVSTLRYVGRPVCAAPAVGQYRRHLEEQQKVIESALFG